MSVKKNLPHFTPLDVLNRAKQVAFKNTKNSNKKNKNKIYIDNIQMFALG